MEEEAIALKDGQYWDSSSIVHNRQNLKEKLLLPYVLYENGNGTKGDIVLNDSAANYKYLEVFGGANGIFTSQKIYASNNNNFIIMLNYNYTTNYVQLLSTYKVVNNRISVVKESCGYLSVIGTTANFVYDKTNYFYILKVVGYK